jgi:hypothetical protein
MLPKFLKPNQEYDLIRLGQDNDGGYLVEKKSILDSRCLITLGLGYDWSFEKAYSEYQEKPVFCYDHTVSYSSVKKICRKFIASYIFRIFKPKYFLKKNFFNHLVKNVLLFNDYKKFFSGKAEHFKKRIGSGAGGIMLNKILEKNKELFPIFLKVDIEGSEYRIFDEIIENQNLFTGIAIELHDIDLHLDKIEKFINELKMELVHIHPQNPAFVTEDHIPTQIELTFAKTPNPIGPVAKLPHKLDQPADPTFEEIELKFDN